VDSSTPENYRAPPGTTARKKRKKKKADNKRSNQGKKGTNLGEINRNRKMAKKKRGPIQSPTNVKGGPSQKRGPTLITPKKKKETHGVNLHARQNGERSEEKKKFSSKTKPITPKGGKCSKEKKFRGQSGGTGGSVPVENFHQRTSTQENKKNETSQPTKQMTER